MKPCSHPLAAPLKIQLFWSSLGFVSFLAPVQGSDTSSQKIYRIQSLHPTAERRKLLGDNICGVFPYLIQPLNPFQPLSAGALGFASLLTLT